MKTKEVQEHISYYTLDDVIDRADALIRKYENLKDYSDFSIGYDEEYGSTFVALVYQRPETYQEKVLREGQEAIVKANREKYERQEFERLKKQFENG